MEPVSIRIEYWTYPDGSPTGVEPDGIDDFRAELNSQYASLVRGRSGECGGLYDFAITIASSISLRDVVAAIVGGAAYDVVKSGTHSFVIRPFLAALKKLRDRNKERRLTIEHINLSFLETDVIVSCLPGCSIEGNLGRIFVKLAEIYGSLVSSDGEFPYQVHIPVFDDPHCDFGRFRSILDVDETIENISDKDYFNYWGVRYLLSGGTRVYDVQRRVHLDERYMTQGEYWAEWNRDWQRKNAQQGAQGDVQKSRAP